MQVCILIMILALYFDLFFMCYTFKTLQSAWSKPFWNFEFCKILGLVIRIQKSYKNFQMIKYNPPPILLSFMPKYE